MEKVAVAKSVRKTSGPLKKPSVEGPIGVIGGSGLYQMDGLVVQEERVVETPWGIPSDPYVMGNVEGIPVVFLSRHGKGHRYLPTEINYRANLAGLKSLGVKRIFSVSAVGSLKEEIVPGDMVVIDDFIDLTRQRPMSFYGSGAVGHTPFGHPICPELSGVLGKSCKDLDLSYHAGGTYICMEGPAFSTRAESNLYRSWGASVIGMTNATEARLAREIGICYATLALATDYDCWHPGHDMVTVQEVIRIMNQNVKSANEILLHALRNVPSRLACTCGKTSENALITDPKRIPGKTLDRLRFLGLCQ